MAFPRERYRYKDKYINTKANMNFFLSLQWLVLFVGLLFSLPGQLSLESNGQIILTTTTLLSLVARMEEKTNLIKMLCRWKRSSTTSRGSSTTRTKMSRSWCSTSTTVIAGAHQLTLYMCRRLSEGSCQKTQSAENFGLGGNEAIGPQKLGCFGLFNEMGDWRVPLSQPQLFLHIAFDDSPDL